MSADAPSELPTIAPDDRRALLDYVRRAAASALAGRTQPALPDCAARIACSGLFVTFRRGAELRGCIGRFFETQSLLTAPVGDVVRSALADPRFVHNPITLAELAELRIELSILSPLRQVDQPGSLLPGVHGVIVSRAGRTGCFLPQVASERGWSIEQFLSECCRLKAGLEAEAWRYPDTRIEAFTATVVHDDA